MVVRRQGVQSARKTAAAPSLPELTRQCAVNLSRDWLVEEAEMEAGYSKRSLDSTVHSCCWAVGVERQVFSSLACVAVVTTLRSSIGRDFSHPDCLVALSSSLLLVEIGVAPRLHCAAVQMRCSTLSAEAEP